MILCHSLRFVYVRTKKTASASVQWALERHCGSGDIVTRLHPIVHPAKLPGLDLEAEPPSFLWFAESGHLPLGWARERVPKQLWGKYFTFTFVRNPWDKMVSAFWHGSSRRRDRLDNFPAIAGSFRDWVRTEAAKGWQDWSLYAEKGRVAVDFVGRHERLQQDYEDVCARIGIPAASLPHFKLGMRIDGSHYSRYYDRPTRKLVERRFRREVETFGYEFEEQ